MAVNILDLFKNQIEGQLVSTASGFLGESSESTRKALDYIAPTLLGGIAQKASTDLGASGILSMLNQDNYESILGNFTGLSDNEGGKLNQLMNLGLPVVKNILGDRASSIIDWISDKAGAKTSSVSSLLSLAAPFIMGLIGRQVKSDNLSVSGLSSLLSSQVPFLKSLIPSGLAGLTAFTAFSQPSASSGGTGYTTTTTTGNNRNDNGGGGLGRFLPWLLLLLGLGLIWYLLRGCNKEKMDGAVQTTETTIDTITTSMSNAADTVKANVEDAYVALKGKVDEFGNWITDLGSDYTIKLPNGKELKVYENSVERRLVDFILTGEKDETVLKEKWFTFDRLYFKKGKSELTDDSKTQLDNIAEILKAFPNVNIKMGGYTDSDGDEAMNQKLSDERAKTAQAELRKRGIGAARIEAEGYGEQHPVCPANDTKECKAQNRRIDVRVTKM